MADRKVEIEMSVKDNVTKQLKSIADSFKKLTRDVQNSCNTIKNSLGNINVRLNVNGVNSQISNINRQINQLDKDVEVNVKARVDSSELSNLSTDNIQDNVGSSPIDIGDMVSVAGMNNISSTMSTMSDAMTAGFTSMNTSTIKVDNALRNVKSVVSSLSPELQQMYSGAIVNSQEYQNDIQKVIKRYENLQNRIQLMNNVLQGKTDFNNPLLTIKDPLPKLDTLRNFNKEIESSSSATIALDKIIEKFNSVGTSISSIKNTDIGLQGKIDLLKNIDLTDMSDIRRTLGEAIGENSPVKMKITPEIQELANIRNTLNTELANYKGQKFVLEVGLKGLEEIETQINAIKTKIAELKTANIDGKNNSAIEKLQKELAELTNKYESVKTSVSDTRRKMDSAATSVEKNAQKFDRLGREIAETTANTGKLKTAMGGLKSILTKIGSLIGIYKLFGFLKDAVNVASSLQEVQNVVDTVFGNMSQTIEDFANNTAKNFGLTQLQAKKFSGTFGSILGSLGIHGENLTKMSTNLSKLAGDLASFNNLNIEDAFYKIRSGITGEVEPLKSLGINMSVATMEAYALSQGLNVVWSELSAGEQAMLRYNYLLAVTQGVQGDFSRTQYSYANSVRVLSNSFEQLKASVGIGLVAALTPIIQMVTKVIQAFTALFNVINRVLGLTGAIKKVTEPVATAFGGISSGIGNLGKKLGGVGKGVKDVGNAAEKAAKQMKDLMGIDELNKLEAPEADKGSGGSGGAGSGGGAGGSGGAGGAGGIGDLGLMDYNDAAVSEVEDYIAKYEAAIEKFFKWLSKYKEAIIAVFAGIAAGIASFFVISNWATIVGTIQTLFTGVISVISAAITFLTSPIGLIVVAIAVVTAAFVYLYQTCDKFRASVNNVFSGMMNVGKQIVNEVLMPIGEVLMVLWNNYLKPVVAFVAGVVLDAVKSVWYAIETLWTIIQPGISFVISAMGNIIGAIKNLLVALTPVWNIIMAVLNFLWDMLSPIVSFILQIVAVVGGLLLEKLMMIWGIVQNVIAFVINLIADICTAIINFCKIMWDRNKDVIDKIRTIWDAVVRFIKGVWDGATTYFKNAVQKISDFFKGMYEFISNGFSAAGEKIKTVLNFIVEIATIVCAKIKEYFQDALEKAKERFIALRDKVMEIADKIRDVIRACCEFLWNLFQNSLEKVKNIWSTLTQFFSGVYAGIKNVFSNVGDWFKGKFDDAKNKVSSTWEKIKDVLVKPFNTAKDLITGVIDKIKGLFTGNWPKPNIKLPHFKIKGSFSLNPPSVPSLGIEWYAKGGIMNNGPTIFGMNGNNLMVGGEKSPEAIIPLSVLWDKLDDFAEKIVDNQNNQQSQNITVTLTLDGKVVSDTVIDNINRRTRINGVSPLR